MNEKEVSISKVVEAKLESSNSDELCERFYAAYDIYEVKYHADIMPKKEMEKEAEKIRAIKGIDVGQIGFISAKGCEKYENDYDCIAGEELYK